MKTCPKCNYEILPYLKTGEVKKVENGKMIKYQLYWCIPCKIVYFIEHETVDFIDLIYETTKIKLKGVIEDEIASKTRQFSSRNSG